MKVPFFHKNILLFHKNIFFPENITLFLDNGDFTLENTEDETIFLISKLKNLSKI